ncbi:hypothetical protein BREVUG8_30062 [Brevundimonas sp. G8]|nr:hypothetical protein BREVUG8_30062 [Brevundimonas sp. G8]
MANGVGPTGGIPLPDLIGPAMMTTTRLSLYKLFLETTVWVSLPPETCDHALDWLDCHKAEPANRNSVNDLYETFVWFPTPHEGRVWVPLGHLTRMLGQLELRTPANAVVHPNITLGQNLRGHAGTLTGTQVLSIRLATIFGRRGQ